MQSSITVIHRFQCTACNAVEQVVYGWEQAQIPPAPQPPEGWVIIGKSCYCPKHEVTLRVRPAQKKKK